MDTAANPRCAKEYQAFRSAPPTPLRIRSFAKSIAPCELHRRKKKLRGGLRGATAKT